MRGMLSRARAMRRPEAYDFPRPNVRKVYATLAPIGVLILLVSLAIHFFVAPQEHVVPMVIVGAVQIGSLALVAAWRSDPPDWLVAASLILINVASTVNIHFGGGYESVFGPMLYTYWIALGGFFLGPRACFLIAVWCSLCYAAMILAESTGLVAHHPLDPSFPTIARPINVSMGLFGIALVTYFALRQMHLVYARAEEMRTEAVRALSHDLKNPLANIIGYASLLHTADGDDTPDRIQRIAKRAADMVHNVLDSGRIETESFPVVKKPVDLEQVVATVIDQSAFLARGRNISIECSLPESLPPVWGDAELLTRALDNLAANAIKYNANGGSVRIAAEVGDDRVLVHVTDTGPGISDADQQLLFRKFGRLGHDELGEGTGLGLYISRAIARAHGGDVSVRSAVGQGSTFTISLVRAAPLGRAQAGTPRADEKASS